MLSPRLHPFARLLLAVIGSLVLVIGVVLVVASATAMFATSSGQDASQVVSRFFADNVLLVNLAVYPPVLLWLWFCRRFFDRRAFTSLGLRAHKFFSNFFGGALCGVLTLSLLFFVLWISGLVRVDGWSLEAQRGGFNVAFLALLGWACAMLCVGFMEEISFRGYGFHNLNAWLGTRAALVIQAVVFALIHLGNLATIDAKHAPDATLAAWLAMPNIALIGVFFALSYLKTGSLWFPIGFHAAWNFFLGCVFSLPVSGLPIFKLFDVTILGSTPLTGGAFGPEASLLLTPILLVMIYVMSRSSDNPQARADLDSLLLKDEPAPVPAEDRVLSAAPEPDDSRENRFSSRMGKENKQLDPDTIDALRALQESRRVAEQHEASKRIEAARLALPDLPPIEPVAKTAKVAAEAIEESTPSPAPVEQESLPRKPKPRW